MRTSLATPRLMLALLLAGLMGVVGAPWVRAQVTTRVLTRARDPLLPGEMPLRTLGRGSVDTVLVPLGGGLAVNPWNGNLTWQIELLPHFGMGHPFGLLLSFNQQDDQPGIFGLGFHSSLEKRIDPGPWESWTVVEADGYRNRFLSGALPGQDDLVQTADRILRSRRLRRQLRRDPVGAQIMRQRLLAEPEFLYAMGLEFLDGSMEPAGPGSYASLRRGAWQLDVSEAGSVLQGPLGVVERFDAEGRLLTRSAGSGPAQEFSYGGNGGLSRVRAPGRQLDLMWDDDAERVIEVRDRSRRTARFRYAGARLIELTVGEDRYQLTWDDRGLLSGWSGPEGSWSFEYEVEERALTRATGPSGTIDIRRSAVGGDGPGQRQEVQIRQPGRSALTMTYDGQRQERVASWSDGRRERVRFAADRPWPIEVEDRFGRSWELEWTDRGQLERVSGPGGEVSVVDDGDGRPEQLIDADGRVFALSWNTNGQLSQVNGPGGRSERYSYTAEGLLSRVMPSFGDPIELGWRSEGLLVSRSGPGRQTWRWGYNSAGLPDRVTTASGANAHLRWTAQGELSSFRGAAGSEMALRYDGGGRLQSARGGRGLTAGLRYDRQGRVSSADDPLHGRPVSLDWGEQLRRIRGDGGDLLVIERNAEGLPQQLRTARGDAGLSWRGARLSGWRRPRGGEVEISHDALGGPAAIADSGLGRLEFSPQAGVLVLREPGLSRWRLELGENEALGALVDGRGARWSIMQGPDLLPSAIEDPDGYELNYAWSRDRRLTRIVSPRSTWSFDWDPMGLRALRLGGIESTLGYGPEGRVRHLELGDGRAWRMRYLPGGGLHTLTADDGAAVGWSYDTRGGLSGFTGQGGGELSWLLSGGRVERAMLGDGREWRIRRDRAGRPSRLELLEQHVIEVDWDAEGRLRRVGEPGRSQSFEHHADGRLLAIEWPHRQARIELDYEAGARLGGWHLGDEEGPSLSFSRDGAGRMVGVARGDDRFAVSWSAAGRLESVVGPGLAFSVARDPLDGSWRELRWSDQLPEPREPEPEEGEPEEGEPEEGGAHEGGAQEGGAQDDAPSTARGDAGKPDQEPAAPLDEAAHWLVVRTLDEAGHAMPPRGVELVHDERGRVVQLEQGLDRYRSRFDQTGRLVAWGRPEEGGEEADALPLVQYDAGVLIGLGEGADALTVRHDGLGRLISWAGLGGAASYGRVVRDPVGRPEALRLRSGPGDQATVLRLEPGVLGMPESRDGSLRLGYRGLGLVGGRGQRRVLLQELLAGWALWPDGGSWAGWMLDPLGRVAGRWEERAPVGLVRGPLGGERFLEPQREQAPAEESLTQQASDELGALTEEARFARLLAGVRQEQVEEGDPEQAPALGARLGIPGSPMERLRALLAHGPAQGQLPAMWVDHPGQEGPSAAYPADRGPERFLAWLDGGTGAPDDWASPLVLPVPSFLGAEQLSPGDLRPLLPPVPGTDRLATEEPDRDRWTVPGLLAAMGYLPVEQEDWRAMAPDTGPALMASAPGAVLLRDLAADERMWGRQPRCASVVVDRAGSGVRLEQGPLGHPHPWRGMADPTGLVAPVASALGLSGGHGDPLRWIDAARLEEPAEGPDRLRAHGAHGVAGLATPLAGLASTDRPRSPLSAEPLAPALPLGALSLRTTGRDEVLVDLAGRPLAIDLQATTRQAVNRWLLREAARLSVAPEVFQAAPTATRLLAPPPYLPDPEGDAAQALGLTPRGALHIDSTGVPRD